MGIRLCVTMSNTVLNLRCKTKTGQHSLTGLKLSSNVGQLKDRISELTKIPKEYIRVRQSYPTKSIDLSKEDLLLSSLPFRSGDTLIVEEERVVRNTLQRNIGDVMQDQNLMGRGVLMRKVVPANNSCLFTSINAVMNGGKIDLDYAPSIRQLIAGVVMSDPQTFSDVFLGRSNSSYCKWIMKDDTWGGAIEISILSKYYDVEIDVVDTQSCRIDRFGEDLHYDQRVLIIYDGVHYDPLVLEPFDSSLPVQTIFPADNASILGQAQEIATEARQARQYTDVTNFSIKCLICQRMFTGQSEAQKHAKASGHVSFGEVK
ncbi:ubiquitin thioesterase OTU1 [Mytilus galloprovincialis]|uniref:Ubiquitin thioesterase OTU n=1 Tax=Mytilus galloprovincialis TaxID=29158 RepID=A0A8B6DNF8_MYTGA|nr:ubiquitin thioesterase OTU1 [Mytilus galloprovincialis]